MSVPCLSRSTASFTVWQCQLKAYMSLKNIDEGAGLSVLPAFVAEEILTRLTTYLSLGTTTLKSALVKLERIWLEIRRPSNPEQLFANYRFNQPSQAADAILQLLWLAEYLQYDTKIVRQRFIAAAPHALQPILLMRPTSDTIDQLVDFVMLCPDEPAIHAVAPVNPSARRHCTFCKRPGHLFSACRRRLNQCLRCGSNDHLIKDCQPQPKN
jgi:hypothetical protein